MDEYLGEFSVELKDTPFNDFQGADWALHFIECYGGIDGAHHKQWLLDQIARILNDAPIRVVQARWGDGTVEYRVTVGGGLAYTEWVRAQKDGEDGPETYSWDEGIPP